MPSIAFAIFFIIFLPNTEAIANTLLKVTLIIASITPYIFAITLRKTIDVLTPIAVSVGKLLVALAML
jgi:hypothetical protein